MGRIFYCPTHGRQTEEEVLERAKFYDDGPSMFNEKGGELKRSTKCSLCDAFFLRKGRFTAKRIGET